MKEKSKAIVAQEVSVGKEHFGLKLTYTLLYSLERKEPVFQRKEPVLQR